VDSEAGRAGMRWPLPIEFNRIKLMGLMNKAPGLRQPPGGDGENHHLIPAISNGLHAA
jgi:hypothetical protein